MTHRMHVKFEFCSLARSGPLVNLWGERGVGVMPIGISACASIEIPNFKLPIRRSMHIFIATIRII
jgi:hypothetical protein